MNNHYRNLFAMMLGSYCVTMFKLDGWQGIYYVLSLLIIFFIFSLGLEYLFRNSKQEGKKQ